MSVELTECVNMILNNKPSSDLKNYYIKNSKRLAFPLKDGTMIQEFATDETLWIKSQKLASKSKKGMGQEKFTQLLKTTSKKLGVNLFTGVFGKLTIDKLLSIFDAQKNNPVDAKTFETKEEITDGTDDETYFSKFNDLLEKGLAIRKISGKSPIVFIHNVLSMAKICEENDKTKPKINPVSSLLACSYIAESLAISLYKKEDKKQFESAMRAARNIDMFLEPYVISMIENEMVQKGDLSDKIRDDALNISKTILKFAFSETGYAKDENNALPEKIDNDYFVDAHLLNRLSTEISLFAGIELGSERPLSYIVLDGLHLLFNKGDSKWVGKNTNIVSLMGDVKRSGDDLSPLWSAFKLMQADIAEKKINNETGELNASFASVPKVMRFCLDILLYSKALDIETVNPKLSNKITASVLQPLTVALDKVVSSEERAEIIKKEVAFVEKRLEEQGVSYKFTLPEAEAPSTNPTEAPHMEEAMAKPVPAKKDNPFKPLTQDQELGKFRNKLAKEVADGIIKRVAQNSSGRNTLLLASAQLQLLSNLGMFKAANATPSKKKQKNIDDILTGNAFKDEIEGIAQLEMPEDASKDSVKEIVTETVEQFIEQSKNDEDERV